MKAMLIVVRYTASVTMDTGSSYISSLLLEHTNDAYALILRWREDRALCVDQPEIGVINGWEILLQYFAV